MKSVPLSEKLLSVICMVQSAKALFVNEVVLVNYKSHIKFPAYANGMKSESDWITRTRNYFFAIDDSLIASLELKKNEYCFDALLRYVVTDEMKNTESDELNKFSFIY